MRVPAALWVALLAGCAASQPPPQHASIGEITVAREIFENCVTLEEPEYDDSQSDAATIARALRGNCSREWGRLMVLTAQGYNSAVTASIYADSAQLRDSIALRVVLRVRSQRAMR